MELIKYSEAIYFFLFLVSLIEITIRNISYFLTDQTSAHHWLFDLYTHFLHIYRYVAIHNNNPNRECICNIMFNVCVLPNGRSIFAKKNTFLHFSPFDPFAAFFVVAMRCCWCGILGAASHWHQGQTTWFGAQHVVLPIHYIWCPSQCRSRNSLE